MIIERGYQIHMAGHLVQPSTENFLYKVSVFLCIHMGHKLSQLLNSLKVWIGFDSNLFFITNSPILFFPNPMKLLAIVHKLM